MSSERFTNNASTTLSTSAGSSDVTLTVASGKGALFPSIAVGQYFSATIIASGNSTGLPNEIVYVTAKTGDTLTVLRAQEGTVARAWAIGDMIANFPTAAFYNSAASIADTQSQAGNFAVDTGTSNAGIVTLSPAPASIASMLGAPIRVIKSGSPNTGAYTLNINSFGAMPVTVGGVALAADQLPSAHVFEVVWNGSVFDLCSASPATPNANLAQMAAKTIKANLTGSATTPSDATLVQLMTAMGYGASSIAANGYFTVPIVATGVVQFGYKAATNNTFNFNITFPNAALQIYASATSSGGSTVDAPFAYVVNQTQFFMATKASNDGAIRGYPCSWIAIGY
jgi:hypothetical protein